MGTVTIKQIKGSSGRLKNHKLCLQGLGLRRINHVVTLQDTPEVRGMMQKVNYLIEEISTQS